MGAARMQSARMQSARMRDRAQAGPLLTHILGTPPMEVPSTYRNDRFGNIESATFELFTLGGSNNRLTLVGTWNSANMEFILVCPGGATWRDAGVNARPYLSVVPPGKRGWGTLTVTHRTGRLEHRDFAFTYERIRTPGPRTFATETEPLSSGSGD